jgi:hypothetical protein
VRTVTLIVLVRSVVSSVLAAMPRVAGGEARTAVPVPAPQTALGREIETLLLALRPALVIVPVGIVVAAVRRSPMRAPRAGVAPNRRLWRVRRVGARARRRVLPALRRPASVRDGDAR